MAVNTISYLFTLLFEIRHVLVFGPDLFQTNLIKSRHYGHAHPAKISESPLILNIRFSLEIDKLGHFPLCGCKQETLMPTVDETVKEKNISN